MHITSLPSPFGMGDMGPEAFNFADFLFRTQQTWWQLLPLTPAGASEGFSPYSSSSTMAGNIYLISPEVLMNEGLLTCGEIGEARLPLSDKADFAQAVKAKDVLLWKAYQRYRKHDLVDQQVQFNLFCGQNAYWLHDFSYFILLKKLNDQKPWWEWADEFKDHVPSAMDNLERQYSRDLAEIRWQQMVFYHQWQSLKKYCSGLNLKIIGDMPFYVGNDSADVWANKALFAIDKQGKVTAVAGVPPDAFSDDGQLWGMPVYNWHANQQQHFSWWIARLKKNLELFDIVRIDHFRALAAYWSIPPGETTAKKGKWVKAPGKALLEEAQKQIGKLPFVAEDLGEIDKAIVALRDAFNLPGINVLQFAFGVNMPANNYIPHHHIPNSVTYTGTHDNNTTRGWFKDLTALEKTNLARYTGSQASEDSVCDQLARLALGSVSAVVILPLQDVLNLDEDARMNTPAGKNTSWVWRLDKTLMNSLIEQKLLNWCNVFDRRRDGDTSFMTSSRGTQHNLTF